MFWFALTVLALSPLLLWLRFGGSWAARPFGLLVLAGCVYHGVSEVLIRLTGSQEFVANRPPDDYLELGMFVAACALLAMTVGYLLVSERREVVRVDVDQLARIFDWRVTGVLLLPLVAWTARGAGYGSGIQEQVGTVGLATQFLVPLTVLTSFGVLLRWPGWAVPVVGVQSVLLALAGQRLEILIAAVVLWAVMRHVGISVSRRRLVAGLVVVAVVGFAVTGSRSVVGRDVFRGESSSAQRLGALAEGLQARGYETNYGAGLVGDAAIRLDSNSWAGQVMWGLDRRTSGALGAAAIPYAALGFVPSAVFPDKLQVLDVYQRSPELDAIMGLGLPFSDFLPGHAALFLGHLGPWGLLLFSLLLGFALGFADRAALRAATPVRLVALMLLVQAALFYERGPTVYLDAGRSFAVLGLILAAWGWLRRHRPEPAGATPPSRPRPSMRLHPTR